MNVGSGELAIATMTLVREPHEDALLRRSMAALVQMGSPVFVCDGGSGAGFVSHLHSLPNVRVVEPRGAGLVGQVRGSVRAAAASGARVVLYTESDKQDFFEAGARTFLESVPEETAGVTLAARSANALRTYPPMQQSAEGTINDLCGRFLGARGDYSYGPFVLGAALASYVDDAADDLGWGWRHFLFAIAHRSGQGIRHVNGEYLCPADQRDEDDRERLHRLRQLGQNVRGLEAGLLFDL
jgi:hypothetical protein